VIRPEAESAATRVIATAIEQALSSPTSAADEPLVRAFSRAASAIQDPDGDFPTSLLDELDSPDRALVGRFRAACVRLGRDLRAGKSASEAAAALAEVVAALEVDKPLAVPRVELCTRVEGFGRLTAIEPRRFLPGRSNQVILYTEVAGFPSKDNGEGTWVTRLATKVTILAKHDGTPVWTRDWQAVTDESQSARAEFFICERVTLSEYLTVGTYVMKTAVRDEATAAVAERSIEFQVVADPSVAAR
jgi:hypothetical protein